MTKKIFLLSVSTTLLFNLVIHYTLFSLVLLWFLSGLFLIWMSDRDFNTWKKLFKDDPFFFLVASLFFPLTFGPLMYFLVRHEHEFQESLKCYHIPKIKFQSPVVFEKREE